MTSRYEPWAGRAVTRDEQGQFARSAGQSRFAQRISALIGQQRGEDDTSYRMQHRPPDRSYGAPLHDPEDMIPGFLAHPEWYADYSPKVNAEVLSAFRKAAKGGPDTVIRVYRAAPKVHTQIRPGDWTTISKTYAREHATGEKGWHIISRDVRAGDLFTAGDAPEWGWDPEPAGFAERTVRRSR